MIASRGTGNPHDEATNERTIATTEGLAGPGGGDSRGGRNCPCRRRHLQPRPTFEQVSELARSKRFDEAQSQGDAYLRLFPRDPQSVLVMAEIALSRPEPEPQRAIELLDRVEQERSSLGTWVCVDRGSAQLPSGSLRSIGGVLDRGPETRSHGAGSGPALIDLLGLQGRFDEARAWTLWQFENEPDVRER